MTTQDSRDEAIDQIGEALDAAEKAGLPTVIISVADLNLFFDDWDHLKEILSDAYSAALERDLLT